MTLHLQRKVTNPDSKYKHQRLSYDINTDEHNKLSVAELNAALNEFSKRSDGEFSYWITETPHVDEEGEVKFGPILYGSGNLFNS